MHIPLFDYAVAEWLLPVIAIFLYTILIYKEKFTSKTVLKIALYTYLNSFIGVLFFVFLAKATVNPSLLSKWLDADTVSNLNTLFKEYNTTEVVFVSYVILGFTYLVLAPISVGFQYLQIKLGNYLGLSFLKNSQ